MSARPCMICKHDSRMAIEQALMNGKGYQQIAKDFGIVYASSGEPNRKAVERHAKRCVPQAIETALQAREEASGNALLTRLAMLDSEVDKVIKAANEGRPLVVGDVPLLNDDGTPAMVYDWRLLLSAVRQGRMNLELAAKLAGRIETDPADLEQVRKHLENPAARRLMHQLEELAAQEMDKANGK